jgi:ribosomal protein L7/L12
MAAELPPQVMDEICDLLHRGEKLQAIKLYMQQRNVTLLEAKDFIERLNIGVHRDLAEDLLDSAIDEEVAQLIFSGQKIAAVKRYREQNHCTLLEAKQSVERFTEILRLKHPQRFTNVKPAGCAAAFLLFAISSCSALAIVICGA